MEENSTTARPRILVLGATGPTGRHIVAEALRRGHDVTALIRSPDKSADLAGVRLVQGDARDEAALREAVTDQDAVVSALGTPASPLKDVTLLSEATRALVAAMRSKGVARLVAITGIGAGDSRGHGGFVFDRLIYPLLLRHVYADKDRQERVIRDSGLDWTIVRPGRLTDGPATGSVRIAPRLPSGEISRADVAAVIVAVIEDAGAIGAQFELIEGDQTISDALASLG